MGIIYLNSLLNIPDNFFLAWDMWQYFFRHAHLQVCCSHYSVYMCNLYLSIETVIRVVRSAYYYWPTLITWMLGTGRRSVLRVDLVLRNLQIPRLRAQNMDDIREANNTWSLTTFFAWNFKSRTLCRLLRTIKEAGSLRKEHPERREASWWRGKNYVWKYSPLNGHMVKWPLRLSSTPYKRTGGVGILLDLFKTEASNENK